MLVRFHFANYRSFRDKQEFSLVSSSKKDSKAVARSTDVIPMGVLPLAAIYGANASGKTNLLRALHFFSTCVRLSHRAFEPEEEIDWDPFFLDENAQSYGFFELDFLHAGSRFTYGFEVTKQAFVREWLYAYPKSRKRVWLERSAGAFRFGKDLTGGENRSIQNITRKNSLFLSAAAQNQHSQLLPIYQKIASGMSFVRGAREQMHIATSRICKDEKGKGKVLELLRSADLGIADLDVQDKELEAQVKQILETIKKSFPGPDKPELPEKVPQVSFIHKSTAGRNAHLPLEEESAGTVAYFSLLGEIVPTLEQGSTLFVDELESSLHPLLAIEIIKLFRNRDSNPNGAQLVFNTHDTHLLDLDLLTRDEIWFVEKDQDGASHLYSLSDFRPRRETSLRKGYLQGRFGAVPYLGLSKVPQRSASKV